MKLVDLFGLPEERAIPQEALEKIQEMRPQPRPSETDRRWDNIVKLAAKLRKLLDQEDTPHEELMHVYQALPAPGAMHLDYQTVRDLSNRLTQLSHPTEASKLRLLQVLADARAAGIPVQQSGWTSAIRFAGKCIKRISNNEVQDALALWKQMESEAGVKATAVTFNVLFDIASKARKFVLADMLMQEMESRGFELTRHSHASLIYSHGLRGDGTAVRKAYRDLVDAGHVVDSTIISCVIEAFLQCGEPAAAEQTFERAKRLHAGKNGLPAPPRGRKAQRELGRLLNDIHAEQRRGVVAVVPETSIAPGLEAYRALIYYYAVTEGNIDRVTALVAEMEQGHMPLSGPIFFILYKGFATHGGLLYSAWTISRLENMHTAFIAAVAEPSLVWISLPLARLCLGAFARCDGLDRAREVHEELRTLWNPTEDEDAKLDELLAELESKANEDLGRGFRGTGRRARRSHFYLRD